MSGLSEEEQNLLRQYRGQELNGYQVRAYAKYDAKKALNEKGYSDDTLKRLAEWQKVLDDYDNAQKLDQAAQEMGSGSFAGKAAATLFSAALAPGKALGNLESLRGVLPSWAGGYQNEDMPTNTYSPAYNASRLSSGIRQSVMQDMNPTGRVPLPGRHVGAGQRGQHGDLDGTCRDGRRCGRGGRAGRDRGDDELGHGIAGRGGFCL